MTTIKEKNAPKINVSATITNPPPREARATVSGSPSNEDTVRSAISAPPHYVDGRKYEPRKVIRDWGLNFNLGSAVKYISRAGRKDDALQDLMKARQFLDFEIEELSGGADDTGVSDKLPTIGELDALINKYMLEMEKKHTGG